MIGSLNPPLAAAAGQHLASTVSATLAGNVAERVLQFFGQELARSAEQVVGRALEVEVRVGQVDAARRAGRGVDVVR